MASSVGGHLEPAENHLRLPHLMGGALSVYILRPRKSVIIEAPTRSPDARYLLHHHLNIIVIIIIHRPEVEVVIRLDNVPFRKTKPSRKMDHVSSTAP